MRTIFIIALVLMGIVAALNVYSVIEEQLLPPSVWVVKPRMDAIYGPLQPPGDKPLATPSLGKVVGGLFLELTCVILPAAVLMLWEHHGRGER